MEDLEWSKYLAEIIPHVAGVLDRFALCSLN